MGDPRKLFDARDVEAAGLYAKRVASDLADLYPVLVDEAGNLCVNMTVGTVSLSTTGTTVTNAAGNPVNVALSSTKVTIDSSSGLTVTPSTTASTITNAVGNPVNVALSSTVVSVTLPPSLSTTATTVNNGASAAAVNIQDGGNSITIDGSVSLTSTKVTVESAGLNVTLTTTAVTASLSNSGVTISLNRSLSSSCGSLSAVTSGTIVLAGTNKLKVYAFSLTTTATTSSVITFVNGTYGGLVLWKAVFQAPTGANAGANLAIAPPAWLFATGSATLLRMNLSVAIPIEFSVAYFDEA